MKIVALKSLNINSLEGKTEIDFEALTQQSSLFAITGPTGSGKSTLLDIISCALYGRTARLKNPTDLMSRHTGECFCEVEFEVKQKRYRSSWVLRRAYNKHDGALQKVKMELVDLDENKILPLSTREVPKKIEELSGLDFGRFMQSMLLAQGGFDAFLKADEKERSALLEKLTGTQIYAQISQTVFEKYRHYQTVFKQQQAVLDTLDMFDEDRLHQLKEHLLTTQTEKKDTDKQLFVIKNALAWFQEEEKLFKEYTNALEAFNKIEEQKALHLQDFKRLEDAYKALSISSKYTTLQALHATLQEDTITLENLDATLHELDAEIQEQENLYKRAKEHLVKLTISYEEDQENLKKVRALLSQIEELQTHLQAYDKQYEIKLKELTQTQQEYVTVQSKYKDIASKKAEAKRYLQEHHADEALLLRSELIAQQIEEYKGYMCRYEESLQNLQHLKSTLENKEKVIAKLKNECSFEEKLFQEKERIYTEHTKMMQKEQHDEDMLYKELQQLQQLEHLIQQKIDTRNEYNNVTKECDVVENMVLKQQLYVEKIEAHMASLRRQYEQELLLKKYEEDRLKLVEGEACFVCGATHHPYAKNYSSVYSDVTKEAIACEEKEQLRANKELQELEKSKSIAFTQQQHFMQTLETIEKELIACNEFFKQNHYIVDDKSVKTLQQQQRVLEQTLQTLKQNRIKKEQLFEQKEQANRNFEEKKSVLQKEEHAFEKLFYEYNQTQQHIKEIYHKLHALQKVLEKDFKCDGETFTSAVLDEQYAALRGVLENYTQTQKALQNYEESFAALHEKKHAIEIKNEYLAQEVRALEEHRDTMRDNLSHLIETKMIFFDGKDPQSYEIELNATYKAAQEQEHSTQSLCQALHTTKQEKLLSYKTLQKKLHHTTKQLQNVQKEFESLLIENGFANQSIFQEALLDNDEKKALEDMCKTIQNKYSESKTLYAQSAVRLEEHRQMKPTHQEKSDLLVLESLLEQKVNALQELIGSDKKELALYEEQSKHHKEQLKQLKQSENQLRVWVKLNELIGSADGTKFKTFAQGITLDQLIYLANGHLSLLSDRYILSRNKEKLLSLEVIDAYQGNVLRPLNTLSGGESFIVSLALALGLSELASQKISIDSLFLDEGFGTLDANSLEMALNALNLLQSGGKMVGVISHVAALKERIPLQIKVVPHGDGVSKVELVGV